MGAFILKITKEFEGEEWENTWGVITPGGSAPSFTNTDWQTASGSVNEFSTATTNPGDGGYEGGQSLIHAILAFERLMHYTPVNFVRLFAWDGIENSEAASTFYSAPLSFAGLRALAGAGSTSITVVPGAITLMLARQPVTFGVRAGRLFLRMCMQDVDVRPGSGRLLDFTDATVRSTYQTLVSTSLNSSMLTSWMSDPSPVDGVHPGIPQYAPRNAVNEGDLVSMTRMSNIVVRYPSVRQVQRGRKRQA